MKPTSQLRLLLVLVGVLTALLLGGCRFPSFFGNSTPPPSPPNPPTTTDGVDLGQQALQSVTDYVKALEANNYAAAYDLLSRDSQSRHSRADFEQKGKQGMPQYDFKTAKATVTGNTAKVEVTQLEEPASHGFHLVREGKTWKIVYRGGSPGSPYAE
ncbi:MAG: nuclear transport factor 2 family protein [Armatimonadota bacterium]